ncbi:hypothetical protein E2C01_029854 [Portunus trituberculatus]|uniref:Uncharacterized protein n=1 Tax=Portunus trituberculatus TaxID=210409 RepID=A0A5B7ET41_PORTR|nr:hypothetical protein [Portunus trituberculatus]
MLVKEAAADDDLYEKTFSSLCTTNNNSSITFDQDCLDKTQPQWLCYLIQSVPLTQCEELPSQKK